MEKSRTYNEWKAAGFQVKKGEKSTHRNREGSPVFTKTQVKSAYDPADEDYYEDALWMMSDPYFDDIGDR